MILIAPVKLLGEGEYNLNVLKEIRVTEPFLGLEQEARKCQNDEPFFNCTSRQYIDTHLAQCGCLPDLMSSENKVNSKLRF